MRLGSLVLVMMFAVTLSVGCSESASSPVTGGTGGDGGTSGTGGTGGDAGTGGEGGSGGNAAPAPYAANLCVGAKQAAAGTFCKSMFDAWAAWETDQDTGARDAAVATADAELVNAWDAAETDAALDDADCSDLALTSTQASTDMKAWISSITGSINDGLDLGQTDEAECGAALLAVAGDACEAALAAESVHIGDLFVDSDGSTLEAAKSAASAAFVSAWADAANGNCPTNATDESVGNQLESLTGELVLNTIVTPLLDGTQYTALEPGPTDYLGRTYEPQCMQGDQYRYFARRGSVNKLVMYYMGGGACWDGVTCGNFLPGTTPTCNTSADLDLNDENRGGFGDLTNDANPFKDWHTVFVTYCSCDVHFGDATQDYPGGVTVQHKGYHNAKVVEKWAREHFLNPEEIFVTGSSAGAYGAWFNAPLLQEVYYESQFHVLADAGNGVITTDFLQNEFSNWNFVANLPDIPGVEDAITTGDGMAAYTTAVATYFPRTNWAHYSTMFDGGTGGQTGFYNIMLNGVLNAGAWWNASCAFGANALGQSKATFEEVLANNYRYYFGTGSKHTMFGNNKVYRDTTGGVPTVVDWVEAMLASRPGAPADGWTNVECENCGLLLEGTIGDASDTPDPRPNPLLPPFTQQGEDVVIVCE